MSPVSLIGVVDGKLEMRT